MQIKEYKILFIRLLFALTLYPLVRVGFLIYNFELYRDIGLSDLIWPLVYGLRFDLSTMLIANVLFIILSLIPYRDKVYSKILQVVFALSNMTAIGFNIIDYEFFKFNGKRFTADLFGMGGDISDQIVQLFFYYWYLNLVIILSGLFYYFYFPKTKEFFSKKIHILITPIIGFLILVVSFIGIRGGLQMRSISPKEAYIFTKYELGHLAINSMYTFVRSLESEKVKKINYFNNDKMAIERVKNPNGDFIQGKAGNNLVVIILESFSQEYINDGYAPFFSKFVKEGLYFDHNLANGRRSIEALPSILTGMPSLLDKPLYQSQFQTNSFYSIAHYLNKRGYKSSFFHGGKTGTMDFDAYTRSIGISDYFGMEDYPNQSDFDGAWGIYDHKFMNWFADKLSHEQQPFFSTIFTLSSHQPYSLPKDFQNKFPKGKLEIHESIGYVDASLEMFFNKIKNQPWFENTLFVITADHTQKTNGLRFNNTLGKYRVPLFFYHPKVDLSKFNSRKITQHADILPSVLDFLEVEHNPRLLYGRSVFSDEPSTVFNYINNSYFLYHRGRLVRQSADKFLSYIYSDDLLEESADINHEDDIEMLKAYIQYTVNGLIKNKLYY